jgi:hypothetical protein
VVQPSPVRGFVYLAAVVDWFSRRVLAWRLSITLETEFCLDAVNEVLARHGKPEIFNTDQGSQFSCVAFTGLLQEQQIAISMDGRGAWPAFTPPHWPGIRPALTTCGRSSARGRRTILAAIQGSVMMPSSLQRGTGQRPSISLRLCF